MNNIIEQYNIIIIWFLIVGIIVSLILGITFAVLKSKNDEYVENERKSNPDFSNTDSETYNALMITFLVLFGVFSAFLLLIIFAKKAEKKSTGLTTPENYKRFKDPLPLMSPTTPDDSTPLGLSGGSNYLGEVRGSGIKQFNLS
jgi:hypothetical protein